MLLINWKRKEKSLESLSDLVTYYLLSTLINWTMKLTFFQFLHPSFQTLNHHTRPIFTFSKQSRTKLHQSTDWPSF